MTDERPLVSYINSPRLFEPAPTEFSGLAASFRDWVDASPPAGRYAMWWPTPDEPHLTGGPAAPARTHEFITTAYRSLRGIEPYVWTALLHAAGVVGRVGAPVGLDEGWPPVFLRDPEGRPFAFSAGDEKGLRLHFHTVLAGSQFRERLWRLFAVYAEAWREAVDESGAPKFGAEPGPPEWWEACVQAVRVAEEVEGQVQVVGALVVG